MYNSARERTGPRIRSARRFIAPSEKYRIASSRVTFGCRLRMRVLVASLVIACRSDDGTAKGWRRSWRGIVVARLHDAAAMRGVSSIGRPHIVPADLQAPSQP